MWQCDVCWDSGKKPEIDNTFFIYNTGNDGLYHLALVEKPPWGVEPIETRGMTEDDKKKLEALSKIAGFQGRAGRRSVS